MFGLTYCTDSFRFRLSSEFVYLLILVQEFTVLFGFYSQQFNSRLHLTIGIPEVETM